MDGSSLLYNLTMLLVDVAVLVVLRRRRTVTAAVGGTVLAAGAAVLLAAMLALGRMSLLRLLAYGVFLHGPLGLLGVAGLLWPVRRRWAVVVGLTAVGVLGVAVDAFWIEPHWLEVTHLKLASPKLSRTLRIAVVADLQTDDFGDYERQLLRQVLAEKPDLILLAGDYLQVPPSKLKRLRQETREFLAAVRFSAPLGVFAVRGNCDPRNWQEAFEGLPIRAVEASESFDLGELQLSCLSMRNSFRTALEWSAPNSEQFHLVLGHAPDFALGRIQADLLVAGHTHGGQVRLPGIGPLLTLSAVPRAWAAGLTDLPSGGKLVVSRGVGLERGPAPRLRFGCRPQLLVIDLVPEERK